MSETQSLSFQILDDPQYTDVLFGGSAGGPQPLDSLVYTPFGPKKMGDVKIGDTVSSPSGGVSRVIDIPYQSSRKVYEIIFADGSRVKAADNHLWKTKIARESRRPHLYPYTLRTTEQIIDMMNRDVGNNHVLIPLSKPVQFTKPYRGEKLDAYLLGALLGDGSLTTKNVTFTSVDDHIINRISSVVSGKVNKIGKITYSLVGCSYEKKLLNKFGIQGHAAKTKFIPNVYKLSPINERWELLRGLFDTDGTVDQRGHVSFTTISRQLALDVQFIARSLGANATMTKNPAGYKKDGVYIPCNDAYTIYIQHANKELFFSLPRKVKRIKKYNNGSGVPHKRIIEINLIGMEEVKCISVSNPDGLYLTDDFVVTHNSKSYFVCMWAAIQCRNYPGIAIGLGRKELKRLKRTTLITLLSKVHPALGIHDSDFKYNAQEGYIEYINGSRIILIDMAYAPTDPDFDKFGSLELTHVIIEEVGEAVKKAVDVLSSRKNRMMNKEYGIVGKTLATCNPTQNFVRQEYYKPYEELGMGRIQKWEKGEVIVPQTGERLPAYRAFVRSSVYDNPFIDDNYIESLKKLDPQERKRLLDGDWNYADDDDALFKSLLMDRATAYELPAIDGFNKFIGVDVADKGKDDTVVTLIDSGVIVAQKALKIPERPVGSTDERPISYMYADELIKFAQQNGFTASQAKRIAIEGNGVGVGMRDAMRVRGWYITLYESTHLLRSRAYYDMSLDMDAGAIKILNGLDDGELRRQLAAHTYEMIEQVPHVIKKDKLKVTLGRSPDHADSAMIANWVRRGGYAATDPRKNPNRIRF